MQYLSIVYAVQMVFIFCMLCLKAALPSFQLIAMRFAGGLNSSVYVCVQARPLDAGGRNVMIAEICAGVVWR